MDSGRDVAFNIREHPHLDHGYAVTSHSSQGQTAERVLIHVDTELGEQLVNSRMAYVSVSRAQFDVKMYTNDAKTLGSELSRDVSHPSALQQDEAQKMGPQVDRGPQVDISQGMGMSLA
jgi:ATP-dependent exoDNAse (exonuclease V) alpha subunit